MPAMLLSWCPPIIGWMAIRPIGIRHGHPERVKGGLLGENHESREIPTWRHPGRYDERRLARSKSRGVDVSLDDAVECFQHMCR